MKIIYRCLSASFLGLGLAVGSTPARADVDVAAKVDQLKQNVEASRSNLSQYTENAKTIELNIHENELALKALAKQRASLGRQTSETAQGKGGVDAAKRQVEGFMKAEQDKIAAEQKQAEALQKALAQLEDNKKRRESNIAAYQAKLLAIDADAGNWAQRTQAISEADKALKEKEATAAADRKRLAEKKIQYAGEVEKWRQQSRLADRQYAGFSKLRDE